MKKTIFLTIALLAMSVTSCSSGNKSTGQTVQDSTVSAEEALNESASKDNGDLLKSEKGLPVVVDFSATWCPPCRQMKPIFERLQTEYEGRVELVTVDVDDNPELAQRYNVSSIPTFVFLSKSGKEIYRAVGLQTETIMRADINKYLCE